MINFWRNSAVALASIFVLSTTLFVIGMFVLGGVFLESTLESIRERVDISVTLHPEISETEALTLKSDLEELEEVREVNYTSREEELETFRGRHEDNPLLLQSLKEVGNPFGARLSVLATDPANYSQISDFLIQYDREFQSGGETDIIDQISFKKDIVDRLLAIINTSEKIALVLSVILVLMSILVTFNTISLTIYISREEISVMRLVGADNSYIRGPFIVEGILAGVIASFISVGLLYPAVIWVRNTTVGVYGGLDLVSYYISNFPQIFVILLISGIILGTFSSFLAIGRYLKV